MFKVNFASDGQTKRTKLSSQEVNFPSAQPLMKSLNLWSNNSDSDSEYVQITCVYFPVPQKYSEPKAKYGVSVAKKKPPAK